MDFVKNGFGKYFKEIACVFGKNWFIIDLLLAYFINYLIK